MVDFDILMQSQYTIKHVSMVSPKLCNISNFLSTSAEMENCACCGLKNISNFFESTNIGPYDGHHIKI